VVEEENDKENSRNNIILYNVVESAERNVKSKHKDEKLIFLQLMSALSIGVDEKDIKTILRFWKETGQRQTKTIAGTTGMQIGQKSDHGQSI